MLSRKYGGAAAQVYRDLLKRKLSSTSTVLSEIEIFNLVRDKNVSSSIAGKVLEKKPKATRPKWVEDGPKCLHCSKRFTATIRRHHCRMCGDLVCFQCAPNERPIIELGYKEAVRVCLKCFHPPAPGVMGSGM